MFVSRMKFVLRTTAVAVWLVALGCGAPLPPPEAKPAAEPVTIAPAIADDEEVVAPESPPDETDAGAGADAGASDAAESAAAPTAPTASDAAAKVDKRLLAALDAAEEKASAEGRLVLATGRQMALVDRVVIIGACWDYANTIYKRAGFPANKRKTIFNRPKTGPYADPGLFEPGDFLSYTHDEKGSWVHSAIFVDWTKPGGHVALMLSYVGGRKPIPALYARNDLSRVFRVVRPRP